MPNQQTKQNNFNLLQHELQVKENLTEKKDSYILINVLVMCFVLAISTMTFLFNVNLTAITNKRKQELAKKINTELNTKQKDEIRSKIVNLNEKYGIYETFKSQNYDVNKFYDEIKNLFPELQVNRFTVEPESEVIKVVITIEKKGYVDLPQFLTKLKSHPRFKSAVIKTVSFSEKEDESNLVTVNGDEYLGILPLLDKEGEIVTSIEFTVSKLPITQNAQL